MFLFILIAQDEVTVTLIPDEDQTATITIPSSSLTNLITDTFLPTIDKTVSINIVVE